MPDMRYHSHSLSSVSASSGSGVGAAAASMAMLPSFSGSGSSGLGAHQHHHQHHHQQYGHRNAGSGSSSPFDAYSTPGSSPLAINPPGSESTTGTGAAGRELTSSVSLGAICRATSAPGRRTSTISSTSSWISRSRGWRT